VARYINVGALRVPSDSRLLPRATGKPEPLSPLNARAESWHEAHATPAGSDKRVSKNKRCPTCSRSARNASGDAAV
jgi:hypothetical protein